MTIDWPFSFRPRPFKSLLPPISAKLRFSEFEFHSNFGNVFFSVTMINCFAQTKVPQKPSSKESFRSYGGGKNSAKFISLWLLTVLELGVRFLIEVVCGAIVDWFFPVGGD